MNIDWPQGIYLFLCVLSLGIALQKHGTTEVKKHSVWESLLSFVIVLPILYWGGFFG